MVVGATIFWSSSVESLERGENDSPGVPHVVRLVAYRRIVVARWACH
jgi:hypothetical protein